MIFSEIKNFHQSGRTYLKQNITVCKVDKNKFNSEAKKLINNASAYTFKEAKLATMGGSELEYKNCVGRKSTIMRLITSN